MVDPSVAPIPLQVLRLVSGVVWRVASDYSNVVQSITRIWREHFWTTYIPESTRKNILWERNGYK